MANNIRLLKYHSGCIQMSSVFLSTVRWRSAQILASLLAVTESTKTINSISSESSEGSAEFHRVGAVC